MGGVLGLQAPCYERAGAMILPFLQNVTKAFGRRWATRRSPSHLKRLLHSVRGLGLKFRIPLSTYASHGDIMGVSTVGPHRAKHEGMPC